MILDESTPCPICMRPDLVYEGMLVWRSGPRPPRELARKNVPVSFRADVEREACYHCRHCGTEFRADLEISRPHLIVEGTGRRYKYDPRTGEWTPPPPQPAAD